MILGRKYEILLEIILKISLVKKEYKLIGLKSLQTFGLLTLEIRTKEVLEKNLGIGLSLKIL